ncbi:Uncharacterized protein B5E39_2720 [Bacillus cereus]|nr:Uncharacterized protein B5E39_2720 [Bacillus cereus]
MIKTLNTELPKALPNMRTVERFAYNVKPRSTDYIKYVREPKIEEVINRLQKMESRFEYKSRIYFVEIVDHEGAILYDECYFECIMELKKEFQRQKELHGKQNIPVFMYKDEALVQEFASASEAAHWLINQDYIKSVSLSSVRASVSRACRNYGTRYNGFEFKYGEVIRVNG